MTVVGVVAEYNPFHLGHIWHIQQSRSLLGENAPVVCVMSGNFVQRGDWAVLDKYARGEMAVRCGADLVLELPAGSVLQSSEGFAYSAVSLLDSLGVVTHLSFGSECGDVDALRRSAACLKASEAAAARHIQAGVSYGQARSRAAASLDPEAAALLQGPNNLLAVSYLQALERIGSAIEPVAIRRYGPGHDAADVEKGLRSASALREMLMHGQAPWPYMPEAAAMVAKREIEAARGPADPKRCETAVFARLRMMTAEDYAALPGRAEGLGNRLLQAASQAGSLEELLQLAKTKRYTMSRLRRLLLCAYLGLREADLAPPAYGKILAASCRGQVLLREIRKRASLPILTKPAAGKSLPEKARRQLEMEARNTDLWVLALPEGSRQGGQDWRATPYMEK